MKKEEKQKVKFEDFSLKGPTGTAADKNKNTFTSPLFLKKLGLVYEEQKEFKSAVETYKKIKTDYPESVEAASVDAYIARSEAKL